MNTDIALTVSRLIEHAHAVNPGGIPSSSLLLKYVQKMSEAADRAITQSSLNVAYTSFTQTYHNLEESYPTILKDIEDFYIYAARTLMSSYKYLYESWKLIDPTAIALNEIKPKISHQKLFIEDFVLKKDTDTARELYLNLGKKLCNLNYSVYVKRNKAVEHMSDYELRHAGLLINKILIHYCIDDTKWEADKLLYSQTIDYLYSNMRGLKNQSLEYSHENKFVMIDFNYFNFSSADRKTINNMRHSLSSVLVPLPVTGALMQEMLDYLNDLMDFLKSKKRLVFDSK